MNPVSASLVRVRVWQWVSVCYETCSVLLETCRLKGLGEPGLLTSGYTGHRPRLSLVMFLTLRHLEDIRTDVQDSEGQPSLLSLSPPH